MILQKIQPCPMRFAAPAARSAGRPAGNAARRPRGRACRITAFAVWALILLGGIHAEAADPAYPAGDDWPQIEPLAAGWDPVELESALDYARDQGSSALLILEGGKLVVERYWTIERPFLSDAWWVHKDDLPGGRTREDMSLLGGGVLAVLTQMARERRLLDLDETVTNYLGKGWSSAPPLQENAISIRQLLAMTSGLDESLHLQTIPGHDWHFNPEVWVLLADVLEAVFRRDLGKITEDLVTNPIGMRESGWEKDWRHWLNPGRTRRAFVSTARDLARWGLLVLSGGRWQQVSLYQASGLQDFTSPSQLNNRNWGLLWWLNVDTAISLGTRTISRRPVASAPDDMISVGDALARRVDVVPSRDLVLVRLGDRPRDPQFGDRLWQLIAAALPLRGTAPPPRTEPKPRTLALGGCCDPGTR